MTPDTSAAPTINRAHLVGSLTPAALLVPMTLSGALYLPSPAPLLRALEPLGYPAYFLRLLGVAKLLGVAALLVPGRALLKEWAYAGFTFDLLAALASHLATGTATHAPPALFALVLVLASYRFAHRGGAPMDLFRRVEQ